MDVKLLNKENILVNDKITYLSLLYLVPVTKYLNRLDITRHEIIHSN